MPAIITQSIRLQSADRFVQSLSDEQTYIFIGYTGNWNTDDNKPPAAIDSTEDINQVYNNIIALKKVLPTNTISAIPRNDWVSGTVYDQYDDRYNIIDDRKPNSNDFYEFYVMNTESDVYKCLNNNYGAKSTTMPSGTSVNRFQTPDGYIWKYMYSIKTEDLLKYMTPNFMPCYHITENDGSTQWLVQNSAVSGTVDNIILTDRGANYNSKNPPIIDIQGDGSGAKAIAQVSDDGNLSNILIVDNGSGYSYATATISNQNGGVGAEMIVMTSPIGGHGSNALLELGGTYKMISVPISDDENGTFPNNITYSESGLIYKPLSKSTTGVSLTIDSVQFYNNGETITGETSNAVGTISTIDRLNNILYLSNVKGTFVVNEKVSSQSYNSTEIEQVLNNINLPISQNTLSVSEYQPYSGNILYFAKQAKTRRNPQQTEYIRIILTF